MTNEMQCAAQYVPVSTMSEVAAYYRNMSQTTPLDCNREWTARVADELEKLISKHAVELGA